MIVVLQYAQSLFELITTCSMRLPPLITGISIIGGLTIASGMFALPYAVAHAGLAWSLVVAFSALLLITATHLSYGEVVANTTERHRLPGYVRKHLGSVAGDLETINEVVSFIGILLSYGILAGLLLSRLFGGEAALYSYTFFAALALLLLIGQADEIGAFNFFMGLPLLGIVIGLFVFALGQGSVTNLTAVVPTDMVTVIGVILFAMTGLSAIADAHDVIPARTPNAAPLFRRIILIGTSLPFITYAVFIFAVLTLVGGAVTEDSFGGLARVIGPWAVELGAAMGLLAVIKSHLSLGFDLRQVFQADLKWGKTSSWLAVVLAPPIVYTFGATSFVALVGFIGGVFVAIDGFFVVVVRSVMRQRGELPIRFLSLGWPIEVLLILVYLSIASSEFIRRLF